MYYNNYNGNNYAGYGVQQPMYRQATSMQEAPNIITRFMNEAEAKAFIVMPEQTAILVDREKGVAYLKFADNMGQSSCRRFKLTEIFEDKAQPTNDSLYITKSESENFVTKKDFDKLVARVNAIRLTPKAEENTEQEEETK